MYKISEFSKLVKLSTKTLRYYEQIGLLKPYMIDKFTKYRYYSDDNILDCEQIKLLKFLNFTLDEIKMYKNGVNLETLKSKEKELKKLIIELKRKYEHLKKIECQITNDKCNNFLLINSMDSLRRYGSERNYKKIINSDKNSIICGAINSGKTHNLSFEIVDNIITSGESLFIMDSKQEYIYSFYDKLIKNNYNVIIINFKNMSKSLGWNPLEYPYKLYKNNKIDLSLKFLENLADDIFYTHNNDSDPFWSRSAANLFIGLILALFEDSIDAINFNSVAAMINEINDSDGKSDIISQYFKLKSKSDFSYVYASGVINAPLETKRGILAIIQEKIQIFNSNILLKKFLNKSEFNSDDIVDKKTAIFLINDENLRVSHFILNMFITQIINILLNYDNHKKYYFILDNLDEFEYLNNLIKKMAMGPHNNIYYVLMTRSLKYLYNLYDPYISKLCNLYEISTSCSKMIYY